MAGSTAALRVRFGAGPSAAATRAWHAYCDAAEEARVAAANAEMATEWDAAASAAGNAAAAAHLHAAACKAARSE